MCRRKNLSKTIQISSYSLQLIHSDVVGSMQTESFGGHKYFVTFIDDLSRWCTVYFLKKKPEVFDKFREYEAIITNQCGQNIGTLCTDNGGEYLSRDFQAHLTSKGISHELTISHTPQQNGVAERMNRTLQESASMLAHAGMPNGYWAEAIATAAYLRNRATTSVLQESKTSNEMWCEKKPNISHLQVFGCVAYAYVPDCERQKLDKKARKLRFGGYCKTSKGYRLYDQDMQRIFKSRDVIFNETDFAALAEKRKKEEALDIEPESCTVEESPCQLNELEGSAQQLVVSLARPFTSA